MAYKFNVFTGQLDNAGTGGSGPTPPGSTYKVEQFTLSSGQASAKAVTLTTSPTVLTATILAVRGGVSQDYSTDFTVTGSSLSWSGLGLDGLLEAGDQITISYI